jgi:hypothetical protein
VNLVAGFAPLFLFVHTGRSLVQIRHPWRLGLLEMAFRRKVLSTRGSIVRGAFGCRCVFVYVGCGGCMCVILSVTPVSFLCRCLSVPVLVFLCLYLCQFVCFRTLFVFLYLCVSVHVCFCMHLSTSVYVCVCLFLGLPVPPCLLMAK